jgi:hypothetical protein
MTPRARPGRVTEGPFYSRALELLLEGVRVRDVGEAPMHGVAPALDAQLAVSARRVGKGARTTKRVRRVPRPPSGISISI